MREGETFKQDTPLEQMVLSVFDKLIGHIEEGYLPEFWTFRTANIFNISFEQVNIFDCSKHDTKDCLYVARLLRSLTQELIDNAGVIEKAIQQKGCCIYATLLGE